MHTDLSGSSLASFPGRVGGEKTAWYPLLAQAPLFPVYFRKNNCKVYVDIPRGSYPDLIFKV